MKKRIVLMYSLSFLLVGCSILLFVYAVVRVQGGQAKIDKFCAEHGNDVKTTNEKGETLLHTAVFLEENVAVVKFIVSQGADVNAQDNNGDTPLHLALVAAVNRDHNFDVANFLVNNGADITVKNNDGKSPLEVAVAAMADLGAKIPNGSRTSRHYVPRRAIFRGLGL